MRNKYSLIYTDEEKAIAVKQFKENCKTVAKKHDVTPQDVEVIMRSVSEFIKDKMGSKEDAKMYLKYFGTFEFNKARAKAIESIKANFKKDGADPTE